MNRGKLLALGIAVVASTAGCAASNRQNPWDSSSATVFVRFVAPQPECALAVAGDLQQKLQLVSSDSSGGTDADLEPLPPFQEDCPARHTVLWGGPFSGQDVTYASVPLRPGNYSFGFFDHDDGEAYQGSIDVQYNGNGVVESLIEWRDTLQEQTNLLGFDNKIRGRFASSDDTYFKNFMKELHKIERLERKIDRRVQKEIRDEQEQEHNRLASLVGADVLMMPGTGEFIRLSTLPTFSKADLESIKQGSTMTKAVFVADSRRAQDKLRRVNELWSVLDRRRQVLATESNRLRNMKRFLRITDHIYNNSDRHVANEVRLQQVAGMLDRLDQRLADQRQYRHALLFTQGLFSEEESRHGFDVEEAENGRQLTVLREEMNGIDARFEGAPQDGWRRAALERDRQRCIAEIDEIEYRNHRIDDYKVALANLKDNTSIIHRQGTSCVFAVTIDPSLSTHLADVMSRESVMKIRLQVADSMFVPPSTGIAMAPDKGDPGVQASR